MARLRFCIILPELLFLFCYPTEAKVFSCFLMHWIALFLLHFFFSLFLVLMCDLLRLATDVRLVNAHRHHLLRQQLQLCRLFLHK